MRLAVASPEDILQKWSHGEAITKPETINYCTQNQNAMVCSGERIFGPVKDINPTTTSSKGVRSREAAIDKNGRLVTKSTVRRERAGHIDLACSTVAHIWFMAWQHWQAVRPAARCCTRTATLRRVAYFCEATLFLSVTR